MPLSPSSSTVADEPAVDKPAEPLQPVVTDAAKIEPPAPPAVTTPVGRDFSEVLSVAPGVTTEGRASDSQDISPPSPSSGTVSTAESKFVVDGANIGGGGLFKRVRRAVDARRVSRQAALAGTTDTASATGVKRRARRGEVRTKDTMDTKFKAQRDDDAERGPTAGLPAPTVTASALSVVVPSLGIAVLHERALLPAGAEHRVEISAREPLISRD